MTSHKLQIGASIVSIKGFDPVGGLVRRGRVLKPHNGPTIMLAIYLPHEGPYIFNVPFAISRHALRTRLAFNGLLVHRGEEEPVASLIEAFALEVSKVHGWNKPYRPEPEGASDSITFLRSVEAHASVGNVTAEGFDDQWFK
jgi:hypothetical protein